jgi:protein transport protein SEC31
LNYVWQLACWYCSFANPAGCGRYSTFQWNPEVATQLIVASDDDRSPSLKVKNLPLEA